MFLPLSSLFCGMNSVYALYDYAVSTIVFKALVSFGFEEMGQPPSVITAELPLVKSPTPVITLIAAYLLIAVTGKLLLLYFGGGQHGQRISRSFRWFILVHNTVLVLLSSYMSSRAAYLAWKHNFRFWTQPYSPSQRDMGFIIYIFYLSKYFEFIDTLIMVGKGAVRQITFLHLYHHAATAFIWWTIAYAAPGGAAWYTCFINSLVHVFMYSYYLLAAALGGNERAKKKYLWWGRYLTQFQMIQFLTMMAQAAYCWASPYPNFLVKITLYYALSLLCLFGHFYISKYTSSKISPGNLKAA
eukprot:jgi/Botrbrau1/22075/Bobra.0206s0003.1